MQRLLVITGLLVAAALLVLTVFRLVDNPIAERREAFLATLPHGDLDVEIGTGRAPLPYDEFQATIDSSDSLWRPLVEIKAPPPKPPEWDKILNGVEMTRGVLGSGDDMKIQMKTPGGRGWYQKGDAINGAKIVGLTRDEVTFQVMKDGKPYSHTLRR